jgi:hypothetical protein
LKRLVETVVAEEFNLRDRGLLLIVDELEASSSPPARLKVWATLHFLLRGSSFCCPQPECHVPVHGKALDRIGDALRRRMSLRQDVKLELTLTGAVQAGVVFDLRGRQAR